MTTTQHQSTQCNESDESAKPESAASVVAAQAWLVDLAHWYGWRVDLVIDNPGKKVYRLSMGDPSFNFTIRERGTGIRESAHQPDRSLRVVVGKPGTFHAAETWLWKWTQEALAINGIRNAGKQHRRIFDLAS